MRRKIPTPARKKSNATRKTASPESPNASPSRSNRSRSASPVKTPQTKSTTQRKSIQGKNVSADVSRRTRKFKQGTRALRQIKALQRTTNLLIPKSSFCRVVKEIMNSFSYESLRIQSSALEALQEAAEMYMVQFFEDSLLCTLHAKRVTLKPVDCHLMRRLRGPTEVCNK